MKRSTKPIICCGFTPCVQRILEFKKVEKGAVNRAVNATIGIGGKGANVARMVSQLGSSAELVEFVGGPNGRLLEKMLMAEGIGFRHLEVEGETRVCQTLLEEGGPDATELVEEMPPISASDWQRMLELFQTLDLFGAVVAVSGKLPAGAPEEGYAVICQLVAEKGASVLLDTQGTPLLMALPHRPMLVKINEAELRAATGEAKLLDGCRRLRALGAQSVLITRGSQPAFYMDDFQTVELVPPKIKAVNPIGSGDAVTAGIAVALNAGEPMGRAVVEGMACGAANALNLLSGFLRPADVARLKQEVVLQSVGE
ncbi:MAG: PfkB family carbohydrate kinase [Pontiella sp.]